MVNVFVRSSRAVCLAGTLLISSIHTAGADPLNSGWALDSGASTLTFGSTDAAGSVETHAFQAVRGIVDRSGAAIVKLRLASLDTGNDMRDVRLRFLFFETFRFPEATVRTHIQRDDLFALEQAGELTMTLPFRLELQGAEKEMSAEVIAALGENNTVSIRSVEPVMVRVDDFGLSAGLSRLEDAYYEQVQTEFPVSFNFVFRPYETDLPRLVSQNELTPEACETRLSEAVQPGEVRFDNGSFDVSESSQPALVRIYEVVRECEDLTITVEGHTDSVGPKTVNQNLSERRAKSVAQYLVKLGLPEDRVTARGRGESVPIVPNDTAENRAKNRRIEFLVDKSG